MTPENKKKLQKWFQEGVIEHNHTAEGKQFGTTPEDEEKLKTWTDKRIRELDPGWRGYLPWLLLAFVLAILF